MMHAVDHSPSVHPHSLDGAGMNDAQMEQDRQEQEYEQHEQDGRSNNNQEHDTPSPLHSAAVRTPAQPSLTTTSTRRASLRRHVKTSKYTVDEEEEDIEGGEEHNNQDEHDPIESTRPSSHTTSATPSPSSSFTPDPSTTTKAIKRSKNNPTDGTLPRARKSTAGAPRIHQCMHCTKSFARRSDLQRHIRTHLGDKPFVCEQCQKRFIQISALKVHQRIHSGEKPYKCSNCDKCFADSSSLVRHKRVHSGERPYKCTLSGCERSFCRNVTLLKHQLREHGLESCKEDGKPYLSLLPSSERPRRVRKPKPVIVNNFNKDNQSLESTSTTLGQATSMLDTSAAVAASIINGGAAVVASSSSSNAPLKVTRKTKYKTSTVQEADDKDFEEENDADHFETHQVEEQVKAMNKAFDISDTNSRRSSTNSFTSQRSITNNHSISNAAGEQQGLQGDNYGYLNSKTTYGLTTVYAAKQRLGSLQLNHDNHIHPIGNGSAIPTLSIPSNPLSASIASKNKTGLPQLNALNGGRKSIDIQAASNMGSIGHGPLTPDTPNSARSCFSAPEINLNMNIGKSNEIGASPFFDIGYNTHSHPSNVSSNGLNTSNSLNEHYSRISNATSADSGMMEEGPSESNGTMGVEETYPSYHRNVHLHNGQMFIHTNMQGMHGSPSSHGAGPYSAGYTTMSHHHQMQDLHHPSSATAPATQTIFMDHQHHQHHTSNLLHLHPHQPSAVLQHHHQGQGQYDHLPTPASASSFFSNSSSGTGTTDKQSTAPSSAPATSPYAHSFPQAVQSHNSQQIHQGGSNSSTSYMHYTSHDAHHYGYGTTYATQQYTPEPPLSAGIPSTPGYYGEHIQHQIHYRQHNAGGAEWGLPHSGSMEPKSRLDIPSLYHRTHHPITYRHPNEHYQRQSEQHYIPNSVTRSNSFHVKDIIGEEEHRKSSLPSAVTGNANDDIISDNHNDDNGDRIREHSPSFENMFKIQSKSNTSPLLDGGASDESM